MGTSGLPDILPNLGGSGCIHQANHDCTWYNSYVTLTLCQWLHYEVANHPLLGLQLQSKLENASKLNFKTLIF